MTNIPEEDSMRAMALLFAAATMLAGCSGSDDLGTSADELSAHEVIPEGTTLRVTASRLNVRSRPSLNAAVLTELSEGDVVTCAETSGRDGWVHVANDAGDDGWVFGKYVQRADGAPDGNDGNGAQVTGPSCDPARGQGVVNRYEKALHDAIAYAEGTRGNAKDGYNVLFSNRTVSSCRRHPNQCLAFGSSCSTAAGRYQFLTTTWNSVASARSLATFEPENQEKGAAYLVANVRRVSVPSARAMTASEFSNAMAKLSYEWASLPPGRYGQPSKTMGQVRAVYCSVAGC